MVTIVRRDLGSLRLDPSEEVIVVPDALWLDLVDHGSVSMIWNVGVVHPGRWIAKEWVMSIDFDVLCLERFAWISCRLDATRLVSPSAIGEW